MPKKKKSTEQRIKERRKNEKKSTPTKIESDMKIQKMTNEIHYIKTQDYVQQKQFSAALLPASVLSSSLEILLQNVGDANTELTDDVIAAALTLMNAQTDPQVSPHIGYFTPAEIHFKTQPWRTGNHHATFMPMDKNSINIHPLNDISPHWVTTFYNCQQNTIYIYDSLKSNAHLYETCYQLRVIYGENHNCQVKYSNVVQQGTDPICGVLAIAFAFSCLNGDLPEQILYNLSTARLHLKQCLRNGCFTPFPECLMIKDISSEDLVTGNFQQICTKSLSANIQTNDENDDHDIYDESSTHVFQKNSHKNSSPKHMDTDCDMHDELDNSLSNMSDFKQKKRSINECAKDLKHVIQIKSKKRKTCLLIHGNCELNDKSTNLPSPSLNMKQTKCRQKICNGKKKNLKRSNLRNLNDVTQDENKEDDNIYEKIKMDSSQPLNSNAQQQKLPNNMKKEIQHQINLTRIVITANCESDAQLSRPNLLSKEERHKLSQRKYLSNMTTEQKEIRKLKAREQKRNKRAEKTVEKIHDDRQNDRIAKQHSRSKRTPQQVIEDRQNDRISKQHSRTKRTPQQVMDDRQDNNITKQHRRSKRTPQQVIDDRQDDKISKQHRRSKRTPQQVIQDRQDDKISKQEIRSNRSPDKIKSDRLLDKNRKLVKKQQNQHDLTKMTKDFKKAISEGPTYTCTCCLRLLYHQSVQHAKAENYKNCSQETLRSCLTGKDWICKTCHISLQQGNIPAMASCNKLQLQPLPDELACLTELEARLIAKRIPFMKLLNLPSGKQKAIVGSVVNVPVDTTQTCASLPRSSSSELGFIPLKLKRKKQYTGHEKYQMIRPAAVENGLRYLQQFHKLYKDITLNLTWQEEFENDDEELWQALTDAEASGKGDAVISGDTVQEQQIDDQSKDDRHICSSSHDNATPELIQNIRKSNDTMETSIRNNQTAQNQTIDEDSDEEEDANKLRGIRYDSCLQPENIAAAATGNKIYSIAPGEGRLPTQILQDEDNEVLTFPNLFPTGEHGFDAKRDVKLSLRKYFISQLCHQDSRFATNVEYLFYAQFLTDFKQVSDNINIALRKANSQTSSALTVGQVKDDEYRKQLIKSEQGYQFLQTVRGSPAYCKQILYDLLAMIKQLGPFTWFLTLSAADLRWPETIQIIAAQFNITLTTEEVQNMSWEDRCAWIRKNPVTAARQFDYRVQQFIKHIINNGALGNSTDFFYRVEFQQRGSPHIHMVLWSDDAPDFESTKNEEIADFINTYISCSLPSEDDDEDLYALVNTLQRHVHSQTCGKKSSKNADLDIQDHHQTEQ